MTILKILFLTRYDSLGASSRVRFFQYFPWLESHEIKINVSPLFSNKYLTRLYAQKPAVLSVVSGYINRLVVLMQAAKYDLVVIEKELFPYFPPIVELFLSFLKIPFLADYDDAIHHQYDQSHSLLVRLSLGSKIKTIMRVSTTVMVGNSYLEEYAKSAGAKNVIQIPSVVDCTKYYPSTSRSELVPIVGWIGTPKTSHYLDQLIPVFENLTLRHHVRFVAVGARAEDFSGTAVEVWPWIETFEVAFIQQFDIGIMPLLDTPWDRGKCGYKLIQYMACAIPVVASPVGANNFIVKHGHNGFLSDSSSWYYYLSLLLNDPSLRQKMGLQARQDARLKFSIESQRNNLLKSLLQAAEEA